MFKGGYQGKVLWVDLGQRKIETRELDPGLARKYIGGSGIGARLLYDLTGADTDPLGPDNPLIFLTGPCAGTRVPTSGRHQVVAKSPLTGIWGESDIGGTWGKQLKEAGFDGVVVTGEAERPVYIWIADGQAEIRDAGHLWGKDTYEVDVLLREETDSNATVHAIGPAGENLVPLASIMSDGKHGRAAGRCGLGAVMGAKKLKALVARGTGPVATADPDKISEMVAAIAGPAREGLKGFSSFGTGGGVIGIEQLGDLPIKNWYQGKWEEGAQRISGQRMAETILTGRYFCAGCFIGCGREVKISEGPYAPVEGAGPEYETLAMFGAMALIDNLEAIARANEVCNRLGLDTISTGGVVCFAMEAYEKGILSKEDTDGLEIRWGDPDVLVQLIDRIASRQGIGVLLGQGVKKAAEELGGLALEFAIHTKGLEFPAHDPRAHNSQAVSYATSNRGACHLQSFSHMFEKSCTMPELGYPEVMDRFGIEGRGRMAAVMQDLMCLFDSLKMCKFMVAGGIKVHHLVDFLNAVTGWDFDQEELMRAGERIFNLKRLYNVRCGVSRKDDTLPDRILVHRRGAGGAATNLPPVHEMLSQYYEHRGWDEMGVPRPDKLAELGLDEPEAG